MNSFMFHQVKELFLSSCLLWLQIGWYWLPNTRHVVLCVSWNLIVTNLTKKAINMTNNIFVLVKIGLADVGSKTRDLHVVSFVTRNMHDLSTAVYWPLPSFLRNRYSDVTFSFVLKTFTSRLIWFVSHHIMLSSCYMIQSKGMSLTREWRKPWWVGRMALARSVDRPLSLNCGG